MVTLSWGLTTLLCGWTANDAWPISRGKPPSRGAHWVRPELVAQIGFTEWTDDGLLRHPRFQGLRDDRKAADVVREVPA